MKNDLCKTCENYWTDFVVRPEKQYIARCNKIGLGKCLDEVVPYPCIKCPFDSYVEKEN